jgi:hypothetical protein
MHEKVEQLRILPTKIYQPFAEGKGGAVYGFAEKRNKKA